MQNRTIKWGDVLKIYMSVFDDNLSDETYDDLKVRVVITDGNGNSVTSDTVTVTLAPENSSIASLIFNSLYFNSTGQR